MKGCIEYPGARMKGYGWRWFRGKATFAHRAAWIAAFGPIPEGMCVLHRCDNPPCINLDHLFLGTKRDNYDDMVAKGRGDRARGVQHGRHLHPEAWPRGDAHWTRLHPELVALRSRGVDGRFV